MRWTLDGQRYVHSDSDSTRFVYELFKTHGDAISELEVRRSSIEDTYLALVHRVESETGEARSNDDTKEPVP